VRANLTSLWPIFINLRHPQLPAGDDDSPARSVAETNHVVVWARGVDTVGVDVVGKPADKSVDGARRLHQPPEVALVRRDGVDAVESVIPVSRAI
jgi:hypothetical protein